jgi:hypothetical protein
MPANKQPELEPAIRETVDRLVAEWATIKDQQEPGNRRIEEIKKALPVLMGYRTYGRASVQHNRRFNAEKFEANYPPETYPQYYKKVPDVDAAKASLGTDATDAFYSEYDPKVVVK